MITKAKEEITNLPTGPGVYQFFDESGKVLYVGKAKHLKKRLSQYFNNRPDTLKTQALLSKAKSFKVLVTTSEQQALLLENELIKTHAPRYNILLRDAKSYPYLFLSQDKHPRIGYYRGRKKENYRFFGPYANAYMTKSAMHTIRKIFKIRECSNNTYRSRSRPCLEYQVGMCSAPCVGIVSDEDYKRDVKRVEIFLNGKTQAVLGDVASAMHEAAAAHKFEEAARLRDQLIELRKAGEQHLFTARRNVDFVGIAEIDGTFAVEVLHVREDKLISQSSFYPKNTEEKSAREVLESFLTLNYLENDSPKEIIIDLEIPNKKNIEAVIKTRLYIGRNPAKRHFLSMATLTAQAKAQEQQKKDGRQAKRLTSLAKILGLNSLPNHIECFDISHTGGQNSVASCVVFLNGMAHKKSYRQFNVDSQSPGDDCAAIHAAVFRRYKRLKESGDKLPDLLLIDGGIGQLRAATAALFKLSIAMPIVSILKEKSRKSGLESLVMIFEERICKIKPGGQNLGLLLAIAVRDEAHRFALARHRRRRATKTHQSSLETISGVSKKRRRALLDHFGGFEEIAGASVEELQKVASIGRYLATKIANQLQPK